MLEIKPLEAKDYESKYRAAYWQQLSSPQDGMWEVFAQMAGYSELIWGGKPCGFVSVNDQNQLLHFFVMPQHQHQVAEIWQSVLEEKEIQTAQVGSHDPQFFGLCLDQHKTVKVHALLYHNPKGNRGQNGPSRPRTPRDKPMSSGRCRTAPRDGAGLPPSTATDCLGKFLAAF